MRQSQEPLSRGALVARVGVPNDVMQFWLRNELILPMEAPGGRGRHLRFAWYEANIAAIMNQLRILGVRIEGMLSITRIFRQAIVYFDELGLNRDEVHALWSMFRIEGNVISEALEVAKMRTIAASPDFDPEKSPRIAKAVADYADYSMEEEYEAELKDAAREVHGAQRVTNKVAEARLKVKRKDFYLHLDSYLTITEQPGPEDINVHSAEHSSMTYFWRSGDGEEYRFKWGEEAGAAARQDGAEAMIAVDVTPILYKVWNGQEGKDE